MELAAEIAADDGSTITAVHVIEIPPQLPLDCHMLDEERAARSVLEEARALAERRGVRVHTRLVRAREAGEAIVEETHAADADVVVLRAPRAGERRRKVFGKTVDYVLKHAPCRVARRRAARRHELGARGSRRREAPPDRAAAGDSRARGHAPPEDAGAADLLLGPDLLGRVRHGGSARGAGRGLARLAALRAADLGRDLGAAPDRRASRTARGSRPTRARAAARTCSRARTSASCRRSLAGAALLTDYILTVAVSVAAGVFALTSAAPSLGAHRVLLSLGCIVVLTVGNLRGVREAGLMFAFPTYAFLAVMYVTLGVGVAKCTVGTCPTASVPHPLPVGAGAIGLFVLLKAFASGSAALTGVESISNGVTRVPPPAGEKCRDDAPADGGLGGDALPRRVVPGGEDGRAAERDRVCALAGRARDLPGRLAGLGRLLPRPGVHACDPGARREHVVPGLPAAGGAPRPRQLPASPVREPRRPARLLERDPRPDRRGVGPDRRLRRERELADPPLRDRRLHGVHARAGGNGALLAADAPAGVALERASERHRRRCDLRRRRDRDRHEVRRGRVDGDRRDPDHDRGVLRACGGTTGRSRGVSARRRTRCSRAGRSRTRSSSTSSASTTPRARRSGTRTRSRTARSRRCMSRFPGATRGSGRASSSGRTAARGSRC